MNSISNVKSEQKVTYLFDGAHVQVLHSGKQTNDAFALLHGTLPPGLLTPPHLHENEEETAYVLEGELQIDTKGETFVLTTGDTMLLPRNVPHRLSNRSEGITRLLMLSTPAGFGNFVEAVGQPIDGAEMPLDSLSEPQIPELIEASQRHGIIVVDQSAL